MGVFKKKRSTGSTSTSAAIVNEGTSALTSAYHKRYCASSIMIIACARNPAHNSPFLTSRVDTNLTPTQMKLDDIPRYKSAVEMSAIP
jgi:hypothetical protein